MLAADPGIRRPADPPIRRIARLRRQAYAERQARQRLASPAHPGRCGLGVIAELLRDPARAPGVTERPDRSVDGLPDLVRGRRLRALQRRYEQRIGGLEAGDREVVMCWPHRGPPRAEVSP